MTRANATRSGDESRFDREYYRRFYRDGRTSVTSRAEMTARAQLIAAYTKHIGCPVSSMLDAGCGLGLMREPLLRALPGATYVGLEYSEYLCQRYGWIQGSIADFESRQPFDLVVCFDVLQYLDEADAARAIRNLARLCRGVLFFSALTRRDWRENADQSRTDRQVAMRTARWYRERLARHFRQIGAGFWIRRGAPLVTWELESAV
ncbi:MAG: class I SAM-dependent methyltransferase [Gammaproteobacteria bacterium]|nr:class I SAM-dependent methyltransferase [Gammaproteobacteria bacterium]